MIERALQITKGSHNHESRPLFEYNYDFFLSSISKYLDVFKANIFFRTNKSIYFSPYTQLYWKSQLESYFPHEIKTLAPIITLHFSNDGIGTVHRISNQHYSRTFSYLQTKTYANFSFRHMKTSTLIFSNNLSVIKQNNIQFNTTLLNRADKYGKKTIDLILGMKNSELNTYIFNNLKSSIKHIHQDKLKLWALKLDQQLFWDNYFSEEKKSIHNFLSKDRTLLSYAIEFDAINSAEALLNLGANPDIPTEPFPTVICNAVKRGQFEIVRLLWEKNYSKNNVIAKITPIIRAACIAGKLNIMKYLYSQGNVGIETYTSSKGSLLYLAVKYGHMDIIEFLLQEKADLTIRCERGFSLLYIGAKSGKYKAVNRLLREYVKLKMSVDEENNTGQTPLSIAAAYGYAQTCTLLLEHGANIETESHDGWTPLLTAAGNGRNQVVDILCENNINLMKMHPVYGTALHLAVHNEHLSCVIILSKKIPNINIAFRGKTALHSAAEKNNPDIIETLLHYGASVDQQTDDGETPLYIAVTNKCLLAVKTLLANGANPNIGCLLGQTPLHIAAQEIHNLNFAMKIIQQLILAGANPSLLDIHAKKPADHATHTQIRDTLQTLEITAAHHNKSHIAHQPLCLIDVQPIIIKLRKDIDNSNSSSPFSILNLNKMDQTSRKKICLYFLENYLTDFEQTIILYSILESNMKDGIARMITHNLQYSYPILAKNYLLNRIDGYLNHNSHLMKDLQNYVIKPFSQGFSQFHRSSSDHYFKPIISLSLFSNIINYSLLKNNVNLKEILPSRIINH